MCVKIITACTVVQAVVYANGQVDGDGQISTPQLRNRLTDFDEIRILEMPSKDDAPTVQNFILLPRRGHGLGEYPVCYCCVSLFVFFWSFVCLCFLCLSFSATAR